MCESLFSTCVKNRWALEATDEQLSRIFKALDSGATIAEVAAMIWVFSEGVTRIEIIAELRALVERSK